MLVSQKPYALLAIGACVFVLCVVNYLDHQPDFTNQIKENKVVLQELYEIDMFHYMVCVRELYGKPPGDLPEKSVLIRKRDQLRARLTFSRKELDWFRRTPDNRWSDAVVGDWRCPKHPPAFTTSDGYFDMAYFTR